MVNIFFSPEKTLFFKLKLELDEENKKPSKKQRKKTSTN